uniref:G-patch domain-containing protein n=1 Tax=Chenopodium quinoa TaxID=63459 RepID=A0A803LS24_CHEQI
MEESSTSALNSSNIGFQLLKKHGWKEGTGLGASQQGRLEPVKTYVKKNKRGLGAEKWKKKTLQSSTTITSREKEKTEKMSKKEKALSKRVRKMLDEEKRRQENEVRQAFFREIIVDTVSLASWQPSDVGFVKVDTDAHVLRKKGVRWGADLAEAAAAAFGVEVARNLGYSHVILESDAQNMVNAV